MSKTPDNEPECSNEETPSVELAILGRTRDLEGFSVRRMLPSSRRRLVAPFIFFDHMGPAEFAPGQGIDVPPHPHIALATITYLFEGEILHRDSLASLQSIRPGDVNWMIAGRGIVHSERTPPELRARGHRLHGIQCWVALPLSEEETEPRFEHHPADTIPVVERAGVTLRVIAGAAYGEKSPATVLSSTLYVHALLDAEAVLPVENGHAERAIYVVSGAIVCDDKEYFESSMLVLNPKREVSIRATQRSSLVIVGGAQLEGPRYIDWNFVSSSKDRIQRAKADWKAGRFPRVLGDETEFMPLPDA